MRYWNTATEVKDLTAEAAISQMKNFKLTGCLVVWLCVSNNNIKVFIQREIVSGQSLLRAHADTHTHTQKHKHKPQRIQPCMTLICAP